MSAPKMNPTNKVKARRFNLISEEDEQTLINGNHSSPKFDVLNDFCTVPHVSKLESSLNKPQTGNFKLNRVIFLQKPGSKMTSIKIPDVSPNPPPKGSYDGLQAVGSNDFRRRGSELSKKADNTYNKMTLCKQQGRIAETVETVKLRRKFRFVKLLITGQHPPLQINNRHPVSEEDIIHYSAMVELAHNSHKKTLGVLYPKVHCSYQSLGESLMPNGEIDNFLIPCFCRMLFEERHPSSSGRHYFFPHIGESILIYVGEHQESTVRTSFQGAAKASKGRNLGHKDNRLFFPIVNSGHWFTFVVDFEYESFVFLDSFYDKESNFHRSINNQLINNFTHLWELIISIDHNFGRFKVLYPNVPKQQNLKDCGIFAMFLMEKWKPNVDLCNILSYQDILNIRIIYANRLFFSPQNQTDMSLVTDFYAAG